MGRRMWVPLIVTAVFVAACSGDDSDDGPTATAPESVESTGNVADSPPELSTVPVRTGELTLRLGEQNFEVDIGICDLDPEGLEFLAFDQDGDAPIRVEYSDLQGGRLLVVTDPADVLDLGSEHWIGEPEFEYSATAASAAGFVLTDSSGTEFDGDLEISCP